MYGCTNPNCNWTGGWYDLKTRKDYAGIYQGRDSYEEIKVCPFCEWDVEYIDDWSEKIMHNYTEKELIELGYELKNAKITDVSLSMGNYGCLTSWLVLNGDDWAVSYGGNCLGHGYLGGEEFEGMAEGLEYLMRVMDVVGVESWEGLKNKHVRVATKGWGNSVKIIGNLIKDKWFDCDSFFRDIIEAADNHD